MCAGQPVLQLNGHKAVQSKMVGRVEPEYLGKLAFYVEALDRDVRKPHENPAIGVLRCASKDDEVVEYALSPADQSPPGRLVLWKFSFWVMDC